MSKFSSKTCITQWFCVLTLIVVFSSHNFVFTELIQHYPCSHRPSNHCEIINVTITPCPEVLEDEPCNYYRETNTTVEVYFRPNFHGTNLTVQRYSTLLFIDLPDPTFTETDACKHTSCPAVPGKVQRYKITTPVLKTYPPGAYAVKWKVWNEHYEECCFATTAVIV